MVIDTITYTCPYCENVDVKTSSSGFYSTETIRCKECGKLFWVKVQRVVKLDATSYKNLEDVPKNKKIKNFKEKY